MSISLILMLFSFALATPPVATPSTTLPDAESGLNDTRLYIQGDAGPVPMLPDGSIREVDDEIVNDVETRLGTTNAEPVVASGASVALIGRGDAPAPTRLQIMVYREGQTNPGSHALLIACDQASSVAVIFPGSGIEPCTIDGDAVQGERWRVSLDLSRFCERRETETYSIRVFATWISLPENGTRMAPPRIENQWWLLPVRMC